ncbi:MAG: 4Fe-4S dicluster domain-containing protein [Planctomycetes bacterium]|jgi:MinD superfamily P-loop ATPase|nr:4Fe-4S dicluster domain-containing protein [Planctomycetota bacterium]
MNELVIISGKGGTGKTSIVASFAALAGGQAVLADCDVDAADLHLLLWPDVIERHDFYSGKEPSIDRARCTGCGKCMEVCRFGAIVHADDKHRDEVRHLSSACRNCSFCLRSCPQRTNSDIQAMMEASAASATPVYAVDPLACEGCGVCAAFCPAEAIDLQPRLCGEWMVSQTRHGLMVHAKLGIAAENSGKLVSTVRHQARQQAEQADIDRVIIDGSPGTGCPVIASITGASRALIVTEPTLSGCHDLQRVAELTRHFDVPASVCVNKANLNPGISDEIASAARELGLGFAGTIRYDAAVTQAQLHNRAVVETASAGSAEDIRTLWNTLIEQR